MWREALHDLAHQQHGTIERRQAVAVAPSRSAARHELAKSHWHDEGAGAYRLRGAPETKWQRAMIAVLQGGPGAVVSHQSAAALWGMPGAVLHTTHITTLRNANSRGHDRVVLHRARRLAADHVTTLNGVPMTRPERVPFDLANVGVPARRVERVIDRFWSDRLVSGRSLRRVAASLPTRGFRGTVLMRELLSERPNDWVPPASGLEGRVKDLLAQAGYEGIERQIDLGADEWIGRVDFVDRQHKVVIEVQSERHHAALSSQRDDEQRFARLRDAGFTVIEVWENDVWHRPQDFLDRFRAACAKPRQLGVNLVAGGAKFIPSSDRAMGSGASDGTCGNRHHHGGVHRGDR